MGKKVIAVQAFWDAEAKVWVATSEDLPGLVTEADTAEKLSEKLKVIIPELIELNQVQLSSTEPLFLDLTSHLHEPITMAC
ncbi:MAG: DUF1902 domain-containing protein [Nodularia sp. (in: Bacteria)]|nr:MAG: DUF1902 domain-containing protein [Nodularia sp. (in: cyanobacteria)]